MELGSADFAPFGHFLISTAIGKKSYGFYASGEPTLFLPGYGDLTLDAKKLLPGANVINQLFASAGTEQDPRIVGAIEVGEPAHDLKPPATVVYLIDIDPKSEKVVKQVEIKRYETPGSEDVGGPTIALAGSSGDVVAVSLSTRQLQSGGSIADSETLGFDIVSEKVVWNQPGHLVAATFKGDGAIIRHEPGVSEKFCMRDSAVNLTSGEEVFGVGGEYTSPIGFVECLRLDEMSFPVAGVLAVNADSSNNGSKVTNTAYDFGANREVKLDPTTKLLDEHSDLILAQRYNDEPIQIIDRNTGQVIYVFDKATVDNVSLSVTSLLDKKLWAKTTSENLVLDAMNGKTLERGWTTFPAVVVDDWVLYSDGRLVPTP